MRNLIFKIVIAVTLFLWVGGITFDVSYGHSGGTDSNGGHTNKNTGEYHYHPDLLQRPQTGESDCPDHNPPARKLKRTGC